MSVWLAAWEAPMDCDIAGLGLPMMTDDSHVPGEWTVFGEPAMNCLSGEVAVRSPSRFDNTCWSKKRAIDAWMIVHMCVAAPHSVIGATADMTMPFGG